MHNFSVRVRFFHSSTFKFIEDDLNLFGINKLIFARLTLANCVTSLICHFAFLIIYRLLWHFRLVGFFLFRLSLFKMFNIATLIMNTIIRYYISFYNQRIRHLYILRLYPLWRRLSTNVGVNRWKNPHVLRTTLDNSIGNHKYSSRIQSCVCPHGPCFLT